MMHFDYFYIAVTLVMMAVGTFQFVRSPHKPVLRKSPRFAIAMGILLILCVIVLNGLTKRRWETAYILSLLRFKESNNMSYSHLGLVIAYTLVYLGLLQLLFAGNLNSYKPNQNMSNDVVEPSLRIKTDSIFVNARFESLALQYATMVTVFLIGPFGFLYAFVGLLTSYNFIWNGVVTIFFVLTCLALIGIIASYLTVRKYWIFKIIVTDNAFSAIGFMRKINAHWNEIMSMNVVPTGILFGGKMIEVATRTGKFYFPLTMKVKGSEYPKLNPIVEQWVFSDGSKKAINEENCMLFTEIKKHLDKA